MTYEALLTQADHEGIVVKEKPIRGNDGRIKGCRIAIRRDIPTVKEKSCVLAEELGHMILHKKANAIFMDTRTQFNTSKYEQEADLFAMYLLISDEILKEYSDYSLSQLSRILGYCEKLIGLRLK